MIDEILGDEESSAQIDVHDKVEILLRDIPKIRPPFNARIVHQNVNLTHLSDALANDPPIVGCVAQVSLHCNNTAAESLDCFHRFMSTGTDDAVIYDDIGTIFRQANGNCLADALSATGHAGHFSSEFWRSRVTHMPCL